MAYYSITLIPAFYILYIATGSSVILEDVHQAAMVLIALELIRWFFQMFAVNIYAPEHTQTGSKYLTEHIPQTKHYLLILGVSLTIALWLVLTNLLQDLSPTTISIAIVATFYLVGTFYWVLGGLQELSQKDLYYVWHTNGMRIFLLSVFTLVTFLVLLSGLELVEVAVYYTIITSVSFLVINDLFLAVLIKKIKDSERTHRLYRRVAIAIIAMPVVAFILSLVV